MAKAGGPITDFRRRNYDILCGHVKKISAAPKYGRNPPNDVPVLKFNAFYYIFIVVHRV